MCDTQWDVSSSPPSSPPSSGSASSASSGSPSQLPPADELAAVRAQIKSLADREAELRRLMLTDPSARTGNAYVVVVTDVKTTRFDTTEFRKVHPDLSAEYTFPVTLQRVEPLPIDQDTGEITRPKRKP